MQFKKFLKNNKEHIINYSVLLIGILTCCFTRLTFNMFFCAFIFPGCFLYFARKTKAYIGLPLVFAGCFIGCGISLWNFFISGGVGYQILLALLCGLIIWIPYLLDKLVYAKFFAKHPIILTFLFPLTWVTIDVIMGLTPVANYISIGYVLSQVIQTASVVSLFGLNFITFMIIYFGSAIASFAINPKQTKQALIIAGSICLFSAGYSLIYNVVPPKSSETIRIMTGYSMNDSATGERSKFTVDQSKVWLDTDIAKAKSENAKILMYPEEAFYIYESEIYAFQQHLKEQSATNEIYIVSGIEVKDDTNPNKLEKNLAWVITPNGDLIEYQKKHLVPLDEAGFESGTGQPITFEVDGSKIGLVICMDLEFPSYVSKLGREGCDILLAPSWDWKTMPANHSISDAYRAIENGCNFVRCTEAGHSIATDYKGNVIEHYYNDFDSKDKTEHNNHVFNLPKKGITTVYCWLAPAIDYFYIVGLATLITYCAIVDHKKSKQKPIKK